MLNVGERTPAFWEDECVKSGCGFLELMGAGSSTSPEMQSFLLPTYTVFKGKTLTKQSTNHSKTDVNALVLECSILLGLL